MVREQFTLSSVTRDPTGRLFNIADFTRYYQEIQAAVRKALTNCAESSE